MNQELDNETTLRRYLLGNVSDEERQQIELKMISDGTFFEQVCALEDDLIDEYVCDKLSPEEREEFQNWFLSTPEGVEQVRLATGLRAAALATLPAQSAAASLSVPEPSSQQRGALAYWRSGISMSRYAIAGMAAICLVIIIWMAVARGRLQSQLNELRAQQSPSAAHEAELEEQLSAERARNADLVEEIQRGEGRRAELEQQLAALHRSEKSNGGQSTVASMVLMPGRIRGTAESHTLSLGPDAARVQSQLILARNDYASYRASLITADGREIWTQSSLRAQNRGGRSIVQVSLPVEILFSGDFSLTLQGAAADGSYEQVGNYYFKAVKK